MSCLWDFYDLYRESMACVDWLQSLKQFFINVLYHVLVDSVTLMAVLKKLF